jgi:cytochrome c-type biogenesis protein CcmH
MALGDSAGAPASRIVANEINLMTLWLVLALMMAAAMCAVGWPLARAGRKPKSGSDLAVYRDQLDEIGRDQAAGFIGEAEAQAASIEVSRRLLAAADAQPAASGASPAAAAKMRRSVAVAAMVLLSVGTGSLYLALGSPSLPGQPLSARKDNQSIDTLVAQVEAHLAQNPNDGRGWEIIAPVYLRLGRFDDAVKARRKALALSGESSERLADLGEALTAAADGTISAEAKSDFDRAVALDHDNIKARYFTGLAAEQEGRSADAATIWRGMLASAPADAPWAQFIRTEIARVAGGPSGPSADDIAAASNLNPDQRIAMIRGMVERLAERLSHDGSDVEGWLRLVRSYMVLGEKDKARDAAADARRALGAEPEKLRRIDDLVKGLGLEG